MKSNHLLSLLDLSTDELNEILEQAAQLKQVRGEPPAEKPLNGKSLGLIFAKSSTRTRVSFQVGIDELGGNSLFLDHNALQLGRGETMPDTAKVMSRYLHGVVIRTHSHEGLVEYAQHSDIPVINALTNQFHPCQVIADLMTIMEYCGPLNGIRVAYMGDGASNMANSWVLAATMSGIRLSIGAPAAYQPDSKLIAGVAGPGSVTVTDDPAAAVKDADIVYTDVWVSMGFEDESDKRVHELQPYQVNSELMGLAKPDAKAMHCLPAKRGQEITADVLDGPRAIVWNQAENRLHAQKAILVKLIR